MPIAKLEFQLPEEREDFSNALKGSHYKSVIDELFNYLRQKTKYEDQTDINIEFLAEWLRNELE